MMVANMVQMSQAARILVAHVPAITLVTRLSLLSWYQSAASGSSLLLSSRRNPSPKLVRASKPRQDINPSRDGFDLLFRAA